MPSTFPAHIGEQHNQNPHKEIAQKYRPLFQIVRLIVLRLQRREKEEAVLPSPF